jgi:hypothetical protein
MPLSAWRKWWRRSSPRSKKLNKKPNFRKCFLEILEDRTLLSNIYTVNLTTDTTPNTGQQNGTNAGDLRYCIEQADLNPGSTVVFDSTVFPANGSTTIRLSQGELQIAATMNISNPNGASTILVSGNDGKGGASRVFNITSSDAVVTITGLTIEFGNASPNYNKLPGNQGGDIYNGGTLTLQNDIVTNGFSIGSIGGPIGKGGAIFNAEGQGNTKLTLDGTTVQNSLVRGPNGGDGVSVYVGTSGTAIPPLEGNPGGQGQGGGIYNDVTALLIVENGSSIIGNTALGGDGGNGGAGVTINAKGAPGGDGGRGGDAGYAEGGGIYNAGNLQLNGTSATSVVLADNIAQGGKGGLGGSGGTGQGGARGGNGGASGGGGYGGFADGGAIYNTGSASNPSSISLQYVNFLGDLAIGGAGNNSNIAGPAGNGSKISGGTGGQGGRGGDGGNAQGGAIYTAWGVLTVPNSLFGMDANGVSDQAKGGAAGNGGTAGNGGNSSGGVAGGRGTAGGPGGHGGTGGNGGSAEGGAVANVAPNGGNVSFTATILDSSLAKAGNGGNGGNSGQGGQGAQANEGSTKTPYSAGLGGLGEPGGNGGAGGDAVGGGIFNAIGSLSITKSTFLSNQAVAGNGGNAGTGGVGGIGGNKTSKSFNGSTFQNGGTGGIGGKGATGGNAQGGAFYNLVGAVSVLDSTFKAKTAGGIGNEVVGGTGGNGGDGGAGGQGGDNGSSKGNPTGGGGGPAGSAGPAGNGGLAEGGAGGNEGGNTSLTGDIFTSSQVLMGTGGNGGTGGKGGDGGNATGVGHGADGIGGNAGDGSDGAGFNVYGSGFNGSGFGGAFADTAGNLTVSNSTFGGASANLGNQVVGGAGGAGGVGGGWGHWGHRNSGAWFFFPGHPLAGDGGHGGLGAFVYGGSLSVSANAQTVQINNATFTDSAITSGDGGNGGQAGLFSFEGANNGINGIGGDGGLAQGGAVSLTATAVQSATLSNVTVASSSATSGQGGTGAINFLGSVDTGLLGKSNGDGSKGGNGGSVQGVGLGDINYSMTINGPSSFTGGIGRAGTGGSGGTESVSEPFTFKGGAGGNGGGIFGGGVFVSNSASGSLNFNFTNGSASNNSLSAGAGGNGGNAGGSGHSFIAGGAGGNGGSSQGGGIYILAGINSVNTATLGTLNLDGNVLVGGRGGVGGAGYLAPGGRGGDADGGGLYNSSSNATTASSLSLYASTLAGNQVTSGIGGDAGSGTTANGGAGGAGGNAGNADGAGLFNGNQTSLTVVNTTFGGGSTNPTTPNVNANILIGSRGGRGGNAGTPNGVPPQDGGAGGTGGTIEGADLYNSSKTTNYFINDTVVDGLALNPGLGGAGGSGAGSGGANGVAGANGVGLAGGFYASAGTNEVGNTILDENSALSGIVQLLNSYTGIDYNGSNGSTTAPDAQIAVGTNSFIETVSQTVALYNKTTGTLGATDSLSDFWVTQGKLARADAGSIFGNPTVLWDEQIQSFIIAEQDVDLATHVSAVDIAVSKTATPGTLSANDWNFFQVNTTENTSDGFTASYDAENLGSLGWSHDALVFTLNMVNQSGTIDHVQVNTVSISALQTLPTGTVLTAPNALQTDIAGANLRPTVMHDSKAGDPMWFVQEGGNNQSIKVVEETNLLTAPSFSSTTLAVSQYTQAVAPQQPGGTITNNINSGIQKVAEQNNQLVAAQTVSDNAGNEDNIQWYVIDVSSGTPKLQQEGDVSGGPNVYDAFPSIDINSQGTIGLTYIQSSKAAQFASMYVTGRLTNDLPGTMAAPVLIHAGSVAGNSEGSISGISVDSDGSFWAANQYAVSEPTGNWGTAVAHYNVAPTPNVSGAFTSLGNNILGSTFNSTGFSAPKDQIGIGVATPTTPGLNLGPLLNNGGTTLTDALLEQSGVKDVAIDKGGNTLVTAAANPWHSLFGPSSDQTDQRGQGFPRITGGTVDVGAFEFNPPVIFGLNPPSQPEQGLPFVLTITGTGFATGASVSFGGTTLVPSSVSLTQIQVTVPTTLLPDEGSAKVSVSVPDGSGIAGETLTSNTMTFTINDSNSLTLSSPGNQNNSEGDPVLLDPITSTDPDTTFAALGLPMGLSINSTTGVISGTIDSRAAGTYNVEIDGIDTDTNTVQGKVFFTWTVQDTTAPTLTTPPTQNNNEGDVLSVAKNNTVTVNNANSDVDPGTFTDVLNGKHTLPPGLTVDANGVISGTIDPRAANNSPYLVTITASDNGTTNSVTFKWIVADTTPPVVTAPSNQTSNEGVTIAPLKISAVDADTFAITGLPGGLTYNTTTGTISGTIGAYAAGSYTVNIRATDNSYQSQPVSFQWVVNDTTPPSIAYSSIQNGKVNNNEGDTVDLKAQAQDAQSFTITGLPTGLSYSTTTGEITGTIDSRAAGTYNVTVNATDSAGNVGALNFQWIVADTTPPVVTAPTNQTSNEGQTIPTLSITATDADSFNITGLPGGLTYSTKTGAISGTVGAYAAGSYTVTITATDGSGNTAVQSTPVSFAWTVNDTTPPTFSYAGVQNGTVSYNEGATVDLKATSQDADSFTITGLPSGLSYNATTGEITGTLGVYAAGSYNVSIKAFDGTLSSTSSFTLVVNDTTPPTLNSPGTRNNNESDLVSLQIGSTDAQAGSFTDIVNGLHTLPPGLSISSTGLISGTIDPHGTGSYTVTISASDAAGNVGSTTFTWNVSDTTAPTITPPGDQSNNEGDTLSTANGTALQIQATDADSFNATGLPTGLSINTTTGVIAGTIATNAADNGPYKVTVYAIDNGNSSSVQFTWNVADSTPPSFTNPGDQISNEGQTISLATSPVGTDPGTIKATGLPPGLSIDSNTGVISGTIDPQGAGAYAVTISGSDNGHSTSISLVWRVNDATPPSLFSPGTQNTNNGASVSLGISNVGADPGSFTASGLPAGLSINPNTGVISGTVLSGAGTYTVTVSASDSGVASSVAFAWVVNPLPISVSITSIQNSYVGVFQIEKVTAQVTDPSGITINSGVVTFHVDGETLSAPVVNGFATVTFVTPMVSLDMTILLNDFFTHSLDAVFSDSSGIIGNADGTVSEPGMLLDFMLFLQANQFGSLASQLAQLQQNQ